MMKYNYRFEKILVVKDQEKTESELAFKESVQVFEEIATKLYDLLKKKEDLIEYQQERLKIGSSIDEINHYSKFIDSMEKTIEDAQQKVMQARAKMNWHEQKLLEKSLEVRKYEKMRERDHERFIEDQLHIEAIQLDELSTIAYYKKEIRWFRGKKNKKYDGTSGRNGIGKPISRFFQKVFLPIFNPVHVSHRNFIDYYIYDGI